MAMSVAQPVLQQKAMGNKTNLGPVGFLFSSLRKSLAGIGTLFKHPKLLLPMVVMSLSWVALSYLKLLMPDSGAVFLLSVLTFAQGGMYAGMVGAVGGVVGKMLFSWFITSAMAPLLGGKALAGGEKKLKSKMPSLGGLRGLFQLLAGLGAALVLYHFLSGNASPENAMIGVTSFITCFRGVKRPDGFIQGFLRSLTKGRMRQDSAARITLGLGLGFLGGIVLTFMGMGKACYLYGFVLLSISLFIVFLTRNRRTAAALGAFFMLISLLPLPIHAVSDWQHPAEAYGIDPSTPMGMLELIRAMDANPPVSMELTLVAAGFRNFDESLPLDQQNVLVEQGESDTFFVSSGNFSEGQFNTSVQLNYDTDGWYANATTHFEVNNSWTQDQTETGSDITTEKCYFEVGVVGAASYLYQNYTQPGDVYFTINVPFSYGDMLGNPVSSATQILARVDRVSLTGASMEQRSGRNGQWKLVERKSYMVVTGDEQGTSKVVPFQGEWHKPLVVEGSYYQATVSEQRLYYIRHIISSEGPIIDEYDVTYQVPPDQLTAGEVLTLRVSETGYFDNPLAGTSGYRTERLSGANFLPGTRPALFNTYLSDGSGRVLHLGADLKETWFEEKGEDLEGMVPWGQTTGEFMTLEILLGLRQPFDPTGSYAWEAPVVAFVYQWESTGAAVPNEDDDEGSEDNIFGIIDIDDEWEEGWDSGDWEHAGPRETGIINAVSIFSGVIGAGAAMAGIAGNFGGPGSYKVPGGDDDPSDGTLVVTSPNGSQEIYRRDPVTGEFVSSYGSVLNVDDLTRAQREQAADFARARVDLERMQNRSDGDSEYWRKVNRLEHMRAKLEKEGLETGDALSAHMAARLGQMQQDIHKGKGFDQKAYGAVRDTYGRKTRGEVGDERQLPGDYTDWQHAKDTLAMSSEEIARGESGKAVALRILTGMLTGGQSEMGFEAARSVYTVKDYVNAGGDSWREAVSKAALQTVTEEGIGRVVGGSIGLAGKLGAKVGGKTADLVSRTRLGKAAVDKISSAATKASDFFGQSVSDVAKKALGIGAKQADDAARAMKAAKAARTANAIRAANSQLDDAVKATSKAAQNTARQAGQQTDDIVKSATKQTDTASKAASSQADDAAKAAAGQTSDAAKAAQQGKPVEKPANAYQKAREKWEAQAKKAEKKAQEEIEKYRKANQNKPSQAADRDALYREGQELGRKKVDQLKQAQDRLNRNPGSREAQDSYDEAMRAVQQDKYAMNAMDQYRGPDANELRGKFNMRNEQHTQAALQNTQERLAMERGVDPSNVSFVEATNALGPTGRARPAAAHRTASHVDISQQSVPDYKGRVTPDDVQVKSARIKGTPKDKDVSGRIVDPNSGDVIDIPKEEVERIYQQELYKAHHKGQLPRKQINGRDVLDEDSVKKFAKDMDHTVTDRTGADAYGRGDRDLRTIMNKETTDIKNFEDITSVTGTMEYKSNEWFEQAHDLRKQASELAGQGTDVEAAREMLRQAEALQGEGVRQMVKQFDSIVADQMTAVAATGRNVEISEKLLTSVRVLDQVGKENGITMAQAEAILKGMNTSVDDVVQQSSALMEAVAKMN